SISNIHFQNGYRRGPGQLRKLRCFLWFAARGQNLPVIRRILADELEPQASIRTRDQDRWHANLLGVDTLWRWDQADRLARRATLRAVCPDAGREASRRGGADWDRPTPGRIPRAPRARSHRRQR